jgi:tRNA(Ile2) C34 agmatinyltransferase TiaS
MNRRHLHNLCALLGDDLDVERARDEYLASLDADATARPPVPRCERCGARLSRKRHRCSRCGLRHT